MHKEDSNSAERQTLDFLFDYKDLGLDADKKFGYFEGYGAIFGNKDSVNDIIAPGAFAETLKKDGLPALLLQHDSLNVIGAFTEAYEDERGLYVKGALNLEVQKAREAHSLLKQKALKGLSIGYMTQDYNYDQVSGIRTLKKVKLLEVSIVTFPANDKAKILAVKFLPKTIREFENTLRDLGFGKTQAKAIASDGWKGFESLQRDVAAKDSFDDVRRDADVEGLNTLKNLVSHLKGTPDEKGNQGSAT